MSSLNLFLLGPWHVLRDDRAVTAFKYDKVRALLAYLAVEAERPQRRETLLGLLWPEHSEAAARNNLRQVLVTLREAIGDRDADPPFLLADRTTIQLNPKANWSLDVKQFIDLLAETDRHPHRNPITCTTCMQRLEQAVGLYRGSFLAQFFLPDSVPFEEWAVAKREWLSQLMLSALARLAAYHERRGQYEQARSYARRQLELEPWREEAYRQLMRLHMLAGERNSALAAYEQCHRVLDEGLGVEPEVETTALYEQIREADEDVPSKMERLVLPARHPHTLPPSLTPFVGRRAELATITRLLDEAEVRLLTLLGMGGVGKTRLALQAATEQLDAYADGVYFIPLAAIQSPTLLPDALAAGLGLELGQAAEVRPRLLEKLRERETLLILDSFEHLLEGAPLLSDILKAAPEVTLLVTSRERLQLQGEQLFTVEGYPVPDELPGTDIVPAPGSTTIPAAVAENDAVHLFVQRAGRSRPAFALTGENWQAVLRVCRLVGGLPLAIELAAGWGSTLSCAEIADEIERSIRFLSTELRDVPPRHRSLMATFAHSWLLLNEEEQQVLMQLAHFQGGFRRGAAEAVAGASPALLKSLVDKSLLQRTLSGRYRMHLMVRQYAKEKMEESGLEQATARQHALFYQRLAAEAEPHLTGAETQRWLAVLVEEEPNLRVALEWALAYREHEIAVGLSAHLWRFWQLHGNVDEGRAWLARCLGHLLSTVEQMPPLAAAAFKGSGVLAWVQGDYDEAVHAFERSLALYVAQNDQDGVAGVTNNMGVIALYRGHYEEAHARLSEALALRREQGDRWAIANSLNNLGVLAGRQGDSRLAQHYYEESLALQRELGYRQGVALALTNLGASARDQGNYEQAYDLFQESLLLRRQLGDKAGIATSLSALADAAIGMERPAVARAYYREGLPLLQEVGDKEHIIGCLEGLAVILVHEKTPEAAARLWGAMTAARRALQLPLAPRQEKEYRRDVAEAQTLCDSRRWDEAWGQGEQTSLEKVVAYALELLGDSLP